MKHFLLCIITSLCIGLFFCGTICMAGSGTVTFSTSENQPVVGDRFSVVIQIAASDGFSNADFYVDYDESMVKFLTGGDSVSGGKGTLRVKSLGNTETVNKMTFSIQFKAKKKGAATFSVKKRATVSDSDGDSLSVSSNRLAIDIGQKGTTDTTKKKETKKPEDGTQTNPVNQNKNAGLKSLRINGVTLSPEFSTKVTKYQLTVPNTMDTLYYSAIPEEPTASVRVSGNEGLREGSNQVTVQVVAESGKTEDYILNCKRETLAETTARTQQESKAAGSTGTNFSVRTENGVIILKNDYEFQVQEVKDQTKIPSGYVATSIQINGVQIPAYTMKNDLDNNYLLLYLKGPDGESNVYQYDREEKTLQRYTGDMIEKVNAAGESDTGVSKSPDQTTVVLVCVVIGLVAVILLIFAYLLKVTARNRKKKKASTDSRNSFDDIHF